MKFVIMKSIFLVITHLLTSQSSNIKPPPPNCITCKWFVPYINNDYGKCKMFIEKSNNKKKKEEETLSFPTYKVAKDCRKTQSLCGEHGKLYEKFHDIKKDYIQNKVERLKKIDKILYDYNQFIKDNKNK